MTSDDRTIGVLQALNDEKDKEVARLEKQNDEQLKLIGELSRPVFSRRGKQGDAIDTQTDVHPKTRRQILIFFAGVILAVAGTLILAPIIGSFGNHEASAHSKKIDTSAVCAPLRALATDMEQRFTLTITQATGTSDDPADLHNLGEAVDLTGSADDMYRASQWLEDTGRRPGLEEGIHNPNLSVKAGKKTDPSAWNLDTWTALVGHIHLAGCAQILQTGDVS